MDIDLFQSAGLGHVKDAEDVIEVAVNAAGGQQTHDVQRLAVVPGVVHGLDVDRVFKELAGLNLLGDLGQDLEHDAAGADVGVTDLGVAHLTLGQTYVQTAGLELGAGVFGKELVEIGLPGGGNRVAGCGRGETIAVHDDENGFFHA